jgi:hypothetical protein
MFSWQSISRGDCFVPHNDENKDEIASCLAMTESLAMTEKASCYVIARKHKLMFIL